MNLFVERYFLLFLSLSVIFILLFVGIFCDVDCFSAIMRLSNELVYSGALRCANDDVARATLCTSVGQQQVRLILLLFYQQYCHSAKLLLQLFLIYHKNLNIVRTLV